MKTSDAVKRVIRRINQAESQPSRIKGSYANGGRAKLQDMKKSLLNAPNEQAQLDLLKHWIGRGELPRDLLNE